MPQVQPNTTLNIPEGTNKLRIQNMSDSADGRCNVFTEVGNQNVSLTPNQTKDVQLDGGDSSRLDNVGKTVLNVTYP
jgi:hypothetical protein